MNQENKKAGNSGAADDSLSGRIKSAFYLIFHPALRIPRPEFRASPLGEADLRFALAVADTNPQYRAFLQIIDEAEREALDGARTQVVHDRLCVNSLGMADGAALVRTKLLEMRAAGLRARRGGNEDRASAD
jgi:hypothetical protein